MSNSAPSAVSFHPFKGGDEFSTHLDPASQAALLNVAVFDCANLKEVLLEGWSSIEDGFVWSCQETATLRFSVPPSEARYRLRIVADAFRLEERLPSQRVIVFSNDVSLGEVEISALGIIDCPMPQLNATGQLSIRLQFPDATRPRSLNPNNADDRLLGISLRRVVVCRENASGAASPIPETYKSSRKPLSDNEKAELITRFESLGENCEFGLVQRRCGAEPLGLLRFSSAPLPKLLSALNARFSGMGKTENIEVELSSNGLEYMIQDRAFGFYYHAWVKAGEMTPQQIQAREKSRVPFLVRKLVEDLEAGEKIFVFHAMSEISTASALMLSDAVGRLGPGKVLWVCPADSQHPAGHLEFIRDNLLAGYIDRFAPGDDAYDLSLDCWVDLCRAAVEGVEPSTKAAPQAAKLPKPSIPLVPPYALLTKWFDSCRVSGSAQVRAPYDDVLDVFRAILGTVPVDEAWYVAEYAEIAKVVAASGQSASDHFRKHGYFEGRQPYAQGWRHLQQPTPFTELTKSFRIVIGRGSLVAEFEQEAFLEAVKKLLRSVPVHQEWYLHTYPDAAMEVQSGRYATAAAHYVASGYAQGLLPTDIDIDSNWYVTRYAHVREGLAAGVASSAKDHFIRIGYGEGCQPSG